MTDGDLQHALRLLEERRLWDPEYKPPKALSKLFKSKARLAQFRPQEINRAVRTAVEESASLGLIQAFLAMGASVNGSGTARRGFLNKLTSNNRGDEGFDLLLHATRSGSNELVQLLAAYAEQQTKDYALVTAIDQQGSEKTQTLLDSGTTPLILHRTLCRAAADLDQQAVEFLLGWDLEPKDVYTLAFAQAMLAQEVWHSTRGHAVLRLLLREGAQGDVVNAALLQAEEHYLNGYATKSLIEMLLAFNADVDYNGGLALELAVKAGDSNLVSVLVGADPSGETLSSALFVAIVCGHPADKLLIIINALSDKDGEKADPNYDVPGSRAPLLYEAIQYYPTSEAVVQKMLEIGSCVDSTIPTYVFRRDPPMRANDDEPTEHTDDQFAEEDDDECPKEGAMKSTSAWMASEETRAPVEEVNCLSWACCLTGDQAISAPVLEVLLRFGGNGCLFPCIYKY